MTDSPWNFAAESASAVGGGGGVTMVDGTTFMVCSGSGDIDEDDPHGLFMFDTRVVSRWRLTIDGNAVESLAVTPNGPFSSTFVGRVHDPAVIDAPITVVQRRHIGHGMREDLEVRNHGTVTVAVQLAIEVTSDFNNLFDVKSGRRSGHLVTGRHLDGGELVIRTEPGPDGIVSHATRITCSDHPSHLAGDRLVWELEIAPGASWSTCLLVGITVDGVDFEPGYRCGQLVEDAIPASRLRHWHQRVTVIDTDDSVLEMAVRRAAEDLGALRIFDPDHPDRVVIAAGAPWFMTLFGRDSLLASWMALLLDHDLAAGVLLELAESQGRTTDPITEEQPGRILHEVRFDSASARLLGGSNTYYGTIDATPLFVMLVAELARWTGITPAITALLPAVDRALSWIDECGDRDGDGFVEYLRSDPNGLENQGWKDSWDGVRHADGRTATGPIALCEVQGYVYAAWRGRAGLARAIGEPATTARAFDDRADQLRARFDEAFWLDDVGWYAIGLDGDKRPIGSLTSNIGHLLWTGIVPDHRAERLAELLAGPSLSTGWGIRTLADDHPAYNPLSYHCGSVWPHDTALAVAGLARYHRDGEAHQLAKGLLAASVWSGGRLPELFAGFGDDDLPAPVPYPASCSPQAWAAASPLLLVRSMLGLEPDLPAGELHLRPRLPEGMRQLRLTGVPFGSGSIDITVSGGDVVVSGLPDGVVLRIDTA